MIPHQGDDHIGCLAVTSQFDVKMIDVGSDVADDGCDVGAPVNARAVVEKNPDRFVELADVAAAAADAQLSAECDLKKSVGDLGIREGDSLGSAPDPDALVLGARRE